MATQVRVRLVREQAELETCLRLRWTVFVEELQERPSSARDDADRLAAPGEPLAPQHLIAELLGPTGQPVPAGAGRLVFSGPGAARLERLAVIDDARRQGVGRALLLGLEEAARAAGVRALRVDSRPAACGFFARHGYRPDGAPSSAGGVEQVPMTKEP
jgi:GNAT superfamily N-acetyltransferase